MSTTNVFERIPATAWYAIRFAVLERDQFTCQYCGQHAPNVMLEVDHRIAKCEGGSDDPTNLVTACTACNRGKEGYRAAVNGRAARGPVENTGSLRYRIRELLAIQSMTAKELADALNANAESIGRTLARYDGQDFAKARGFKSRSAQNVWRLRHEPS